MTDGASAAVKEQEEIKALVRESVKEHLGDEWGTMSDEEQDTAARVWCVRCSARARTLSTARRALVANTMMSL